MPSIHIGTQTLTTGSVALALRTTAPRVARQLFIQCNATFNIGDSTVTSSTGLAGSAVNVAGAAQNAPNTIILGTTAGPPLINLNEVFAISATPGAIVTFLWIA